MREILILIGIIVLATIARAMIIDEVYPNPIESETQGEYIVLYNNYSEFYNISNISVATNSQNITLPNRNIPPLSYLMIADNNFLKDNDSWPDPDYETSLTIKNTDGFVRLYENNKILDEESWKNTKEGFSIKNNVSVFPDPKNIEYSYNINMITLNVYAKETEIEYFVDDDLEKEGIQWFYYEGREIGIEVTTNCNEGYSINWFGEEKKKGDKLVLPNTRPGEYNITISSCGDTKTIRAEILPMMGIRILENIYDCEIDSNNKGCNFTKEISNIGNVDVSINFENIPERLSYENKDIIAGNSEYFNFYFNGTNMTPGNYTFNIRVLASEK